jgi:hypothetical protein
LGRIALFAAASLLALALAGGAEAGPGWWGDLDKGEAVRLGDVRAQPHRFRGRSLTFFAVFHSGDEKEFQPLRTPFNAERYDNVSVWEDGAALWEERDYKERDFPYLYVSRRHAQRDALVRLEPFTRIELTCTIESVWLGQPFLEVRSFRVTGHRLGKAVVEQVLRGDIYAKAGGMANSTLAVEKYQRALDDQPDLAPAYALKIRLRMAEVLRSMGRTDEANAVEAGARAEGVGREPEAVPMEPPTRGPIPPPAPPGARPSALGPGEPTPDDEVNPLRSALPGEEVVPTPEAPRPAPPPAGAAPTSPTADPKPETPPEPPPPLESGPPKRRPRLSGVR